MADNTTQGQDRVAAVVARVLSELDDRKAHQPVDGRHGALEMLARLDAAGLLLTEERRERIVALVDAVDALAKAPGGVACRALPQLYAARDALYDALRRELAGDGGAPASEPTPAPRRMAGNRSPLIAGTRHSREHDEDPGCAAHPPCQPVAAAAHDPRDFDPGAGAPMGVLLTDAAPAHEHRWAAVAWVTERGTAHRTRVTREHCTRGDCNETREVPRDA